MSPRLQEGSVLWVPHPKGSTGAGQVLDPILSTEPGAEAAHAPQVGLYSADIGSCSWKNEISEQNRPWRS